MCHSIAKLLITEIVAHFKEEHFEFEIPAILDFNSRTFLVA